MARRITSHDVHRFVGSLEDDVMAQVLATGATLDELMEARQWLTAPDVVQTETHHQMHGRVAQLYEILSANDVLFEED